MQNPKVSVVIPVYNAERTLSNILEKLITQSYKDIEIIAINDGSTDGSLNIIQKFAKKDNRILLVNQENRGASAARNAGIDKAKGEYVTFVDSDDDIDICLISELVRRVRPETDFVMCGMTVNGRVIASDDKYIEGIQAIQKFVLKSLLTKNLLYGPYCKLFRRDVIVHNGVLFPQGVNYGEDTIFVLNYLEHISNLTNIDKNLYRYTFSQSGLAANNSSNFHFRQARAHALNSFMTNAGSPTNLVFLYALIRLRWSASYLKSILTRINNG